MGFLDTIKEAFGMGSDADEGADNEDYVNDQPSYDNDEEGKRNRVKSLIQTTNDFLDLNCDTFYDAIKDSRFTTIANEHPNEGFRSEYASFCKEFHIMEYLMFYMQTYVLHRV